MYAISIVSNEKWEYVRCGNDGVQKLHNKTRRGWYSETEVFRKCNVGNSVYVVSNITQEMCEMSQKDLVKYIKDNYIAILQ